MNTSSFRSSLLFVSGSSIDFLIWMLTYRCSVRYTLDGEPYVFYASLDQLPKRHGIRITEGNTSPLEVADENGTQLRSVVGPVLGALDHHVINRDSAQAEEGRDLPSFDPELQEPPVAIVRDDFLFYDPGLQVTFSVLDGTEEFHVTVVFDDDGATYYRSSLALSCR